MPHLHTSTARRISPTSAPQTQESYWLKRKQLKYYQVVKRWIEELSPGNTIIDVGSRDTPVVLWGDFEYRIRIDKKPIPEFPGTEQYCVDWLEYEPQGIADLIVCLQTLEHLTDCEMEPFTRKLSQFAHHIIISVPYMWEAKACSEHKQDPINLEKLVGWMGCMPIRHEIVVDCGMARLVTIFEKVNSE